MSSATRQETLVHWQPPSFCSSGVQCLSLAVFGQSGFQASPPKSSVLLLLTDNSKTSSPEAGPSTKLTPSMCLPSKPLLPAQPSPPCWYWQNPPTSPEPSFRTSRFLMDCLIVCFQNVVTCMWKTGSNWLASYENKFLGAWKLNIILDVIIQLIMFYLCWYSIFLLRTWVSFAYVQSILYIHVHSICTLRWETYASPHLGRP